MPKSKYAEEWEAGKPVEVIEPGEYKVTILSGPFLVMNKFNDYKLIGLSGLPDNCGYNKLIGFAIPDYEWGDFKIEKEGDTIKLVYYNRHGDIWMIDELRVTPEGRIIGKILPGEAFDENLINLCKWLNFYFKLTWAKKPDFGYFYMDKVK